MSWGAAQVRNPATSTWRARTAWAPRATQFVVDQPSDTATIVLPRSAFGSVVAGWVFTVALTGQDGFGAGSARTWASTPQQFNFGVCAPGATAPICSVDPNTVPKVMDTITPPGVDQATELNPLNGLVTLTGVTVQ